MTAHGLGRLTALCAVVSDVWSRWVFVYRVYALSPAKPIYSIIHLLRYKGVITLVWIIFIRMHSEVFVQMHLYELIRASVFAPLDFRFWVKRSKVKSWWNKICQHSTALSEQMHTEFLVSLRPSVCKHCISWYQPFVEFLWILMTGLSI